MAQRVDFTQKGLLTLPPHDLNSPSKSKEISDPLKNGLKVEISKTGRKTFWFKGTFRSRKINIRIGALSPVFTLADARLIAAEYRAQIDRGMDPTGEIKRQRTMPTFAEFVSLQYLPWAYESKRSANADESKFKHHLMVQFGHLRMNEITRRQIEQYHSMIKNSHCEATANRHLALLSTIFNKCIDWDILEINPARGLKKFKEDNHKTDYLNAEEIQQLLAVMANEPNKVAVSAIKFLLFTGVRRQEALTARWENVDLAKGLLYLPVTKAGRSRHVPLNDVAKALLVALHDDATSPWVFPGKDPSKPYVNLKKPLERLLAAAGLERMRTHSLRHSFATLLVSSGVSLYQVSKLLGHASTTMTSRYSHLAPETLRDASQVVSRIVTQQ